MYTNLLHRNTIDLNHVHMHICVHDIIIIGIDASGFNKYCLLPFVVIVMTKLFIIVILWLVCEY